MVPRIVSINCRSTLASCSARTLETEEVPDAGAAVGAADAAVPAGVERVAGPEAAAGAGVEVKEKVGATGDGESIEYGV
eukprot:257476-Pleurochrysis_carterae.AAC.2